MDAGPTRMCELLAELDSRRGSWASWMMTASFRYGVHVEMRNGRRECAGCAAPARVIERRDRGTPSPMSGLFV